MTSTLNMLLFEILLIYPYVAVIYEGRSFNSGTLRPLPHGCTKIVEVAVISVGSDLNNRTNSHLNPFTLL